MDRGGYLIYLGLPTSMLTGLKCSTFVMEMIFHSPANETDFHKKGCSLGLILKVGVFGTGK